MTRLATIGIFDLDPDDLRSWATERGLPKYFGDQLLRWVYQRGITDPSRMTDLSKLGRAKIEDEMRFGDAVPIADHLASDGTRKLLVGWPDEPSAKPEAADPLAVLPDVPSKQTECVMIPTADRRTACISSQVGCPVGCRFCASGLGGLEGNLTRGRIVEQAWRLGRLPGVGRITNIVFMGMGEPLANYKAVTGAIRTLNAPWGLGISARRITVSTVGVPAAIRRFANFDVPVTLALSLHAPNDDLRREIIPWAEYSTVPELLDACREYFDRSGREITLEYILLGGLNDGLAEAKQLAVHAKKLRCNINLIRYNEVEGLPFRRPDGEDVHRFQQELRRQGVNVHIRASRGRDIAAACGQLRHEQRRRPA
ncbi:MAG: 23S rRNA (adenine(2503)-C(2))-methyltransferase RlmN [Planctomycetaceae bacterium]|nr:23S rRNA (adenine(2503)-C(2))-methyltransferase RlmN [Planctomycetaceae bacterium]